MHTPANRPEWFEKAIATLSEDRFVEIEGCAIHYQLWGNPENPCIVFIHGFSAHSHWWDFIAPLVAEQQYCVAAMDFSGSGDSGHRDAYSRELYAQEVLGVAEDAGFVKPFYIVGHSFGGGITVKTAALFGGQIAGIILADSSVVKLPGHQPGRRTIGALPVQVYPDQETAIRRFRIIPPQPVVNDYIVDYIAAHSSKPVEGGVVWKADPKLLGKFKSEDLTDDLIGLKCKVGVIYGEKSNTFGDELREYIAYILPAGTPFKVISGAFHHLFLDNPLEFVEELTHMLNGFVEEA
jgi:pimeloyl-ACP methyl ester carboxylesterase